MNDGNSQQKAPPGENGDKQRQQDECPVCDKRVEENDTAVLCDGLCQRWHHQGCAELQQGQFNALKNTNKRKSKLLWLCFDCEQDFSLYKAGKSMQKALEDLRMEMNQKMAEMAEAVYKLTSEHSTRKQEENKKHMHMEIQAIREKDKQETRPSVIEETQTHAQKDARTISKQTTTQVQQEKQNRKRRASEGDVASQIEKNSSEPEQQKPEDPWTEVAKKKRNKQFRITGTKVVENNENNLKAGERNAWLYVGRLHPSTTTENVKNYLRNIPGKIECEQLETKGSNKAFKVGIPFNELEKVGAPEYWPQGILVRKFVIFRGQRIGTRLG